MNLKRYVMPVVYGALGIMAVTGVAFCAGLVAHSVIRAFLAGWGR